MRRAVVVLGVLAVACGKAAPSPSPPQVPNVVLITLDTLRADFLGVYGGPNGLTPRIDRFARSAVVFERASTSIGTTFPAHASIFTGLYPKAHRVRWNGDRLDESFRTLPEVLREAGWQTAAFVSLPSMLERGGLDQGFAATNLAAAAAQSGQAVLPGEEVSERARAWLASRGQSPFFLWLHYFEAHSPYPLGPRSRQRFARSGYDGVLAEGASVEVFYSLGREVPWTPETRQALRTLYAEEVERLDRLVGEVLDGLREAGLLAETLVVVTSDHGQSLGEHDVVGHGFLLSEPVLRVPLIVGGWRGLEAPRVVRDRVGLIDLAPTILELASLPALEAIHGRSIAPYLTGRRLPARPYFGEARDLGDNLRWTTADAAALAVLDGSLKAVWRPDGISWFDLDRDPGELAPRAASISERRRRDLVALIRGYRRDSATTSVQEPSQEAIEELKALGYLR